MSDAARTRAAARLLPAVGGHPGLERLVELAARLLDTPSVQVSLLAESQTVVAGAGLAEGAVGSTGPLRDSLCTVTAGHQAPLVVDDAPSDERVAHLPPVTSGAVGAYLAVPLTASGGQTVGALCAFGPDSRAWSEADLGLLEQLAGAVVSELELVALAAEYESNRLRWDVAIDAAGIGSFDWDLVTGRLDWDERMHHLFGYEPGTFDSSTGEGFRRIHPDDRPMLDAAIDDALAVCGDFRAEYRIRLPEGGQRWVAARGRAVAGPGGTAVRLIGTAHDITEVRTARDEAARLLETMATGFLSVDHDWCVTYVNVAGARVVGYHADDLIGRNVWEAFPGLAASEFGQRYREAVRSRRTVEFEAYYEHLHAWFEVRAVPGPTGLALYFLDITARRLDQERAHAAGARLQLLATVSSELAAATLETEQAVARLARLVVPALADWCVVSLTQEDGTLRDVGTWHVDPAMRVHVDAYARHRFEGDEQPVAGAPGSEVGDVLTVQSGATTLAMEHLRSPEAREALAALAPESSIVLPLVARGQLRGVLTLCRGAARRALSEEEVVTAREVASRAGLALDNARLYAQQRGLAEGLQRSLLTSPPEPDHCEIVVRYRPAAQIASVGGDWFDSFLGRDGATTLVIGDVVGHDTEAAAAMGQLRALLRGIAWDSDAPPSSVLSRVDAAMQGLAVDTTASVVVGRLEQTAGEKDRGVARLRWSNAGHPPPMAINGDGSVVVLSGVEPDLLLGIDPQTTRVESTVTLDRGATIVLYTDGLVERRGENLDTGLARLRDTLASLADRPLASLCDELLDRMSSEAEDDDVALIAVRLHRQDRPRPAEAGPEKLPPTMEPST